MLIKGRQKTRKEMLSMFLWVPLQPPKARPHSVVPLPTQKSWMSTKYLLYVSLTQVIIIKYFSFFS
jgi:hypothetical protein